MLERRRWSSIAGAQKPLLMTLDIGRCLLYTIVVSEYKYHLKSNVGDLWTLMRVLKMPERRITARWETNSLEAHWWRSLDIGTGLKISNCWTLVGI